MDDDLWPGSPVPLRAMQAALLGALAPEGVAQMRENAELAVARSTVSPATERSAVLAQLAIARWLGGEALEDALRLLREADELGSLSNVLA